MPEAQHSVWPTLAADGGERRDAQCSRTSGLGVPCLTLRSNTERPITIEEGTNELVGRDRELILAKTREILATGGKTGRVPELWDWRAAERIATHPARPAL